MQLLPKCLAPFLAVSAIVSLSFADIETGLVAYYPFNGNAIDESWTGNDGTITGAQFVADKDGIPNSALYFDGDDYVKAPDAASLDITTTLTLSAWVKLDGLTGDYQTIISKWFLNGVNSSSYVMELLQNANGLEIALHFDDGAAPYQAFISYGPLPTDWFMITSTYDGSNVRIFINGSQIYSAPRSGALYVGTAPLMIGAHDAPNYNSIYDNFNPMHGTIDEVRIYNRVLDDVDIFELFSTSNAPAAPTFTMTGFQSPMDKGTVSCKKNRVLPIKTELYDADGYEITSQDIVSAPVIQVLYQSFTSTDAEDVSDLTLSAGEGTDGSLFSFNESGIWQFNLETKSYSAPGTYTIRITSSDESEYTIDQSYQPASFIIGK